MSSAKNIVCPLDKRRFSSRAALVQHRMAAHGGVAGPSGPAKPPPAPRVRAAVRQTARTDAVISRSVAVSQVTSDTAQLSGVDRLVHIEDVKSLPGGSLVTDSLITPGVFKRLKNLALSFQKIRYVSLAFVIEPQMSTATSGGYVAAFIRDPADSAITIDGLTSQSGSVTTKWWESCRINVPVSDREYYTSQSSEIREFSPGRFVLMADGKATQSGSLTVFVHWKVILRHASLESAKEVAPDFNLAFDVCARGDHQGLWGVKYSSTGAPDNWTDSPTEIIPGAHIGDRFRFSTPIYLVGSDDVPRAYTGCVAYDHSSLLPFQVLPDSPTSEAFKHDSYVLLKGAQLELIPKTVSGEAKVASSSDFLTMTPSFDISQRSKQQSLTDFLAPQSDFEKSNPLLEVLGNMSRMLKVLSDSMAPSSSMGFPQSSTQPVSSTESCPPSGQLPVEEAWEMVAPQSD